MHIDIVAIGNSKGIRIPKALLEQCGFAEHADLRIENGNIILSPIKKSRAGWAEAMQALGADDTELDEWGSTEFDESEWTW